MKKAFIILFCIVFYSFCLSDLINLDIPDYFPEMTYDLSKNELNDAKIQLGRKLFYDPILSKDNTISCASCHTSYNAFAHTDHDLSHGINDAIGLRNAPPLFNLAWSKSFNWDGAINHLDMQALAPINDVNEMGESTVGVINKLNADENYRQLFKQVWKDTVTTEYMLKSLSQFLVTLVSSQSKYDAMIEGQLSYNVQEQNGYQLFKKHCNDCHTEPLFTTGGFAYNGLPIDSTLNDFGKGAITLIKQDSLKFKIPSLRNLSFTYPYMHDGRFQKLRQVIDHYTAIDTKIEALSEPLKKQIVLTSNEKVDLVAFLLTLDDHEFTKNKNHQYPREILNSNLKQTN